MCGVGQMEINGGLFTYANFLSPLRGCFISWSQLQQQGGTTSGDGMLLDRKQDRGCVFDRAAEAEPCGQGNPSRCLLWHVAEIENDQSEAAAFEKQIGGAQGLFQALPRLPRTDTVEVERDLRRNLPFACPHFSRQRRARNGAPPFGAGFWWRIVAATHPQQTVEVYAGGCRGMGIERVAGIDHHAKFSAAGGGGQSRQEQRGASRGSGAADFGQASAGQPTGQGVDDGDAARNHFRGWTNIEARSRSYMGQPGVGRGKLGRADALRRTILRMPLGRLRRQGHFRNRSE